MRALVTGVAGFVGSHLADALLARGDDVVGVDCFTGFYDHARKEANLGAARRERRFSLVRADLRDAELGPLLDGVDVVFHLAGQPGVRLSWADGFGDYLGHNLLATQRLLEAMRAANASGRLVYASSSSVYGNPSRFPTTEDELPRPHSPYGVTKLAAEHLCALYAANWGCSTISLRYFTVYGPRQRPDMAISRLCEAARTGTPFPRYGDGQQLREFTYVSDVVDANLRAADADVAPGVCMNIAGGSEITLADLIELVGGLADREIAIEVHPAQAGDTRRNSGAIDRAHTLLGWSPQVALEAGLRAQLTS